MCFMQSRLPREPIHVHLLKWTFHLEKLVSVAHLDGDTLVLVSVVIRVALRAPVEVAHVLHRFERRFFQVEGDVDVLLERLLNWGFLMLLNKAYEVRKNKSERNGVTRTNLVSEEGGGGLS